MLDVRVDHDSQRQLLQVCELRDDERVRVVERPTRSEREANKGRAFGFAPFVFLMCL